MAKYLDLTGLGQYDQKIKQYIDSRVGLDVVVCDSLPTADIKEKTIYLVNGGGEGGTNNVKDEYIYINGAWELIGTTEVVVPQVGFGDSTTGTDAGEVVTNVTLNEGGEIVVEKTEAVAPTNFKIEGDGDVVTNMWVCRASGGGKGYEVVLYKGSTLPTVTAVESILEAEIDALFA